MWLQSRDSERSFTDTITWKNTKDEWQQRKYTISNVPVEVPDEHADIVMKDWPAYIVAVPDPSKARLQYDVESKKLEVTAETATTSEAVAVEPSYEDTSYLCSKCNKRHMLTSKVGKSHLEFKS